MNPPLRVVLDACVLVPQRLSSLLLTMAEDGLFDVRWSDKILEETTRTLLIDLGTSEDGVMNRLGSMRRAFPEAAVVVLEGAEAGLECDPKDRHVLAAAILSGADVLVTLDQKGFTHEECERYGISLMDPDRFLLELMADDEVACEVAVEHEANRMVRPKATTRDVLVGVAALAPTFANTLHHHWGERSSPVPAYEVAPEEEGPMPKIGKDPDFTDAFHVTMFWWSCLVDRDDDAEAMAVLHALTWDPEAFGDYRWVDEAVEGKSLASRVYRAVDADEVAYLRFVPEVAQSSRVFAPTRGRGAVFVTLRRANGGQWAVWGVGARMACSREVLASGEQGR